MTILGDTGKMAHGKLKTFTFTFPTPRETLSGTPTALPSSNPGTPQVTMTIQQSDLPIITPEPLSTKYSAILYVAGKNTDAATQSVSYQVYKNGSAVAGATGSQSVTANTFWTHSHHRFFDVSVGDVLGASIWCPSVNVNFDYFALIVYPTRPLLGKSAINKDVSYGVTTSPSLSSGTPNVVSAQNPNIQPTNTTLNLALNSALTFGSLTWHSSTNAFQLLYADSSITTAPDSHATNRPSYRRAMVPTSISFREVLR